MVHADRASLHADTVTALPDGRVIGGFRMVDEKGRDDKIVTVAVDDPSFADYTDIDQLPKHVMAELRRFFEDYKVLEGKRSDVDESYPPSHAFEVLARAMKAYTPRV